MLDRLNSLATSIVAVNLPCFLFLAKLPAVAVPQVPNFGGGVAGVSVGGHNVDGGNDLLVGIVRRSVPAVRGPQAVFLER